jgi:hypothetical protein
MSMIRLASALLAFALTTPAAAQSGQGTMSSSVRTPEGFLKLTFRMDKVTTDSAGRLFMSGKGGVAELYKDDLVIYFSGDVTSASASELSLDLGSEQRSFTLTAATRLCDASKKPVAAAKLVHGSAVTVRVLADNVKQALQVSGGYLSMGPVGMGSEKAVHPQCTAVARKGG